MTAYFSWAFNYPVACFLFLETAFVTDPVLHFAPLVFTTGNANHFIATAPQGYFTATFRTAAMCIFGFQEPYTVFEPEGLIGQCTYRTNVNNVTYKVVIERFLNVSSDLGMVAQIE